MKNEKLVGEIGFRTKVTLIDVFEMLKLWRCKDPFMARYCSLSSSSVIQVLLGYAFHVVKRMVSKGFVTVTIIWNQCLAFFSYLIQV